jgi:ketosteroid isomerase-like protein
MSRNASPVVQWYDADVEFNVCAGWPNGGTFHGSRAVLDDFFPESAKAWTRLKPTPEEIIELGDTFVVRGRYIGVARGTEIPFELEFVHIWRVRDARLISLHQIADTTILTAAMTARPSGD